jgi:glycosyltransferase involved in cell wall biosynthesis
VFISLNLSEPYGITFCEALLAGCKIICPATGGQVEFLRKYPNTTQILRDDSAAQIAEAIKSISETKQADTINVEDFTYEKTAKEILDIVKQKEVDLHD